MKAQHPARPSSIVLPDYRSNVSTGKGTIGEIHPLLSRILSLSQHLRTAFGALGEHLTIFAAGRTEPIVRRKRDRQGQTYYTIYDPISRCHTTCASDAEARTWLEQRYYL